LRAPRKDFRHVPAPLANQLAPKPGQDRKRLEQQKKPMTWFIGEKYSFG
jgi:hypothetical protein